MIPEKRHQFNAEFSEEKYKDFLEEINQKYGIEISFRVSETPIFISKYFKAKVLDACDSIISQIQTIDFHEIEQKFLPENLKVPNPIKQPHFLAIDFGLCENENGEIEPQLIELQAFPSLYAYQIELGKQFQKHYNCINDDFHFYFNDLNEESYIAEMKQLMLGNHSPENVILLEIYPEKQKTLVDFLATEKYFAIKTVCLTKILKEENKIFYINDLGKKIQIKRIYNRIIFDELNQMNNLQTQFHLTDNVEVEWVTHPDWFFLISKSILPLLNHKFVPKSYYLNDYPENLNLENYVLKPLFSFAGNGVNLYPTKEIIAEIKDKENYILQKKVNYARIIPNPTGEKSKVELRMLFIWNEKENKPKLVINLARMSKGELINVSHNTHENWIGGTIAFFEK